MKTAALLFFGILCLQTAAASTRDHQALEVFIDGSVLTAMEELRIPGVVISVVQGGEVLLEKGYGYAREPERVPADPHTSLFRIASITKLFNAIALMQLVEDERVDLKADFTGYLPDIRFDLPRGVVRVRDLLTHSAGFEDGYIGHFWAVDEASDRTLEQAVARYQPAQVRAPGERVVYSNYGTKVIGLIVERVSGVPYAEYLRSRVLEPLGMTRSGFYDLRHPDAELALAHSYLWSAGRYSRPGWAWTQRGGLPSGGLVATAHEMALFMLAQLGDGKGILRSETLARMREPLICNHPFVASNAYGYWRNQIWGHPSLQHGGSIFGFMSNLVLLPELDLGIFISTNTPTGHRLTTTLPRRIVAFLDPDRLEIPAPDPQADLGAYVGRYRGQRRGYTTLEKFRSALTSLRVAANDQGYLAVSDRGRTERFLPMGNDRFINPDTGERIAFSRDAVGRPVLLHNDYGHNNFERYGFIASIDLVWLVVGLTILAALVRLATLWAERKRWAAETPAERLARLATVAIALVWIFLVYAVNRDFSAAAGPVPPHFAHYPTPWGWAWIVAGAVGALLTMGMVTGLLPVWRRRNWPVGCRLAYSAYTLLSAAMVWQLHHWNLLGLRMLG